MIQEYGRFVAPHSGTLWHGLVDRANGVLRAIEGSLLDPEPRLDGRVRPLAGLVALPPVEPPIAVAVGLNYPEHSAEVGRSIPSQPFIFRLTPLALNGDRGALVVPTAAQMDWGVTEAWLDPEPEPVAVIGYDGQVVGWLAGNDVSERNAIKEVHRRGIRWNLPDSFGTAHEVAWWKNLPGFKPVSSLFRGDIDPRNIDIELLVNGRVVQAGNTRDMVFPIEELVPHVTRLFGFRRLPPGSMIFCGTPGGIGYQPLYPERGRPPLRAGDMMTVRLPFGSVSTFVVAH